MGFLDYDGLLHFWQQIKTKFAAASHKHAMADVTGLQAALDGIGTRMDDTESSIAELAKRLPIYYYTDVPSESSITEKPQLAVIKGGAVYLVE